jgi:hypothetical protein
VLTDESTSEARAASDHGAACDLALVVGAARSGTTLLRLLLDAHPEIGSPAEAGIPSLMTHLSQVWLTVHEDTTATPAPVASNPQAPRGPVDQAPGYSGPPGLPPSNRFSALGPEARSWVRETVAAPMRSYTATRGKRLYVDKSLDSVYHLDITHALFPNARYILVSRHVMDTVASGLEASPWGFSAYGYGPYVQASPNNTVAALANYWFAHVTVALAWASDHPELCYQVRYEDLVLRPEDTIEAIQDFLGVSRDVSVVQKAFQRDFPRGPGDYKVVHTDRVSTASIGRGKRVPVALLPPSLREALNEPLRQLGYGELTPAWNSQERDGAQEGASGPPGIRLIELMGRASELSARIRTVLHDPIAFVAEDDSALRWVIDPEVDEIRRGDGEVTAVLTGATADFVAMLSNEVNLGVLLRSGRIRHVAVGDGQVPYDVVDFLNRLVARLAEDSDRGLSVV